MPLYDPERAAMTAAGRRLAHGGLVIGTGGNLSIRRGDHVLVTASGTELGALTPEQVTVVDLDGSIVDGELVPTSELPLHLMVYRATGAGAVAHAHAPASIAVGCTHHELPPVHYAGVTLGGPVRVAPYATFGSAELAANVTAALESRSAALMQNHGSVAYGTGIDEACARLELLEWLADLYCRSAALGAPRVLTAAELTDAAEAMARLAYGKPHSAS
jgi:L-fuculose-phosphate aldolase